MTSSQYKLRCGPCPVILLRDQEFDPFLTFAVVARRECLVGSSCAHKQRKICSRYYEDQPQTTQKTLRCSGLHLWPCSAAFLSFVP